MQETQDLDKAQEERTERARSAIQAGKFLVTRISPQKWTVKNGDGSPYAVTLKTASEDLMMNDWVCTCMDFQQRGPQILCKHIEGVRILEAAQNQISISNDKESAMNDSSSTNEQSPGDRINRIIWELRQPLDMSRVKRRQAPGMGSVPYLEGYDVIDRANSIFGFGWSFDLVGEPVIVRWAKKVMVWNQQEKRKIPALDSNGNIQTEEVGLVYITGKVTIDLDGKTYSHADLGRCVFSGDTPEALDMALAGSATDCLKRCFRQLGEQFGNLLYDKEIAQNAGLEQSHSSSQAGAANHQATQPNSSQATTSDARKYADGVRVNGNLAEQEAFDQFKQKKGTAPASREELRSWLATQQPQNKPVPTAA